MKDSEKLQLIQEMSHRQKDDALPLQQTQKEKLNVYKMTLIGFLEHLIGYLLMICVLIAICILLYIAIEVLFMLRGKELHWRNVNWDGSYIQSVLSNWVWIFIGSTLPGFIQGVSFVQGELTNKVDKDKSVKFGLMPLVLGSLIFPGSLAFLIISSINPVLFHFDGFFKIIGLIFFGIFLGAIVWWRVINEKLKIRSSRSWW